MTAGAIRIEVPGAPVAKGRPRLTTRGGFARAYTPAKTRRYEDLLRLAAGDAMNGRQPLEGPLQVTVAAYVPIPQSTSKRDRAAIDRGELHPTKRPDIDNFLKTLDGLNGVCWRDDSQIVQLVGLKSYSERPRLMVMIEPVEVRP